MKKSAVFLVFIFLSLCSYAQSDSWYFSLSMGGSWPSGTFKQTNIENNSSGYARKGFTMLLDATYPVTDHWGLKGTVLINTSPVDRNWLGTRLETRMKAVPISVADADREFLSLRANAWMWNALLAGPLYTISFDRIFWDFQLLGGMNVGYLPQQKLLYEKPANNWFYLDRNTSTTNIAYGVLVGTAFRFPISDRVNLKIEIDNYRSQARVPYEQIKVSKQGETLVTENIGKGSVRVPIRIITGTIGFVYYLK